MVILQLATSVYIPIGESYRKKGCATKAANLAVTDFRSAANDLHSVQATRTSSPQCTIAVQNMYHTTAQELKEANKFCNIKHAQTCSLCKAKHVLMSRTACYYTVRRVLHPCLTG